MATASAAPGPSGMQQVDLTKLGLHQLAQLKQQLDQVHIYFSILLFNGYSIMAHYKQILLNFRI